MVKVMVTDDGKKIFEKEGRFFMGAVLNNEETDYSTCTCGDARMIDILTLLKGQATRTLKAISDDQVEYIASITSLSKALRNFVQKEINKNPDKLVQGFEELVKDL